MMTETWGDERYDRLEGIEETLNLEPPHEPRSLKHDVAGHFGDTYAAVDEDDGNLADTKALLPCKEIGLYLKGVTVGIDRIQFDAFENLASVTFEPPCRVANMHSRDVPCVHVCKKAEHEPAHRPVYHIYAGDIARSDHQIVILCLLQQPRELIRIVGKIRVHLKNEFEIILKCVFESGHVGGSQSQFCRPFDQMDPLVGVLHELHQAGGSVRGIVVDDEYFELPAQRENAWHELGNIIGFVVSRDDDERTTHGIRVDDVTILELEQQKPQRHKAHQGLWALCVFVVKFSKKRYDARPFRSAETIKDCWSSVNSVCMGSERTSRAACSVTGKVPSGFPAA